MDYESIVRCKKCGLTMNETFFIEDLCVTCHHKENEYTDRCKECGNEYEKEELINSLCIACFNTYN